MMRKVVDVLFLHARVTIHQATTKGEIEWRQKLKDLTDYKKIYQKAI